MTLTQNIPRHQTDGHAALWHNRRPGFWWMGVLLALPPLPFHPPPSQPPPHRNVPVAEVLYLLGVAMATPAASPRVLLPAARQDQGPAVSPAGLPTPRGERPGPAPLFGAPPPSVGGCRKHSRPSAPRQRSVLPTALPPPRSTHRKERSGAGGLKTQIRAGRELQPPPARGTAGAPACSEVGGQGDGGCTWLGDGVGDSPSSSVTLHAVAGGTRRTLRTHRMCPRPAGTRHRRARPKDGGKRVQAPPGDPSRETGVPPRSSPTPAVSGASPRPPTRPASVANCLTLHLWSCRDSGAKFAEPSLFHCEVWGGPPLPQTPPGVGSG